MYSAEFPPGICYNCCSQNRFVLIMQILSVFLSILQNKFCLVLIKNTIRANIVRGIFTKKNVILFVFIFIGKLHILKIQCTPCKNFTVGLLNNLLDLFLVLDLQIRYGQEISITDTVSPKPVTIKIL